MTLQLLRIKLDNCVLFFVLLMAIPVTAQVFTNEQSGLLQLINNTSGEEKVENMLKLARDIAEQQPDSSLFVASQALSMADSMRNRALSAEARYTKGLTFLIKNEHEEAFKVFSQSLQYAQQVDDIQLLVKNMIGLAEIHHIKMQYDSSRKILETAKVLAEKYDYDKLLSNIYNNTAKISDKEGNYTVAIEGYLKAAELFKEQNRLYALAAAYGNIGGIYYNLKNYQDAIQYFMIAAEINQKENMVSALHNTYNSLGNVYSRMDSLEKARYYFTLVIQYARKGNNDFDLAKGYLNLANLLNKKDTYDEALKYYDSSIYLSQKNNILYGIIIGKMNLGKYYNNIGNYKLSLKTLREVKTLVSKYDIPGMEATVYAWLSDAFKGIGVYDSALYYFEQYERINDSISGQVTRKKVLELEKKYQSERKAREIAELQQDIIEEQSSTRFFIIALIFVIVMFLTFGLLVLSRRRAAALKVKLSHQEYHELENTMELRNQELVSKALMVSNLNEQLEKINNHVRQIKPTLSPESAEMLDILVKDLEVTLPGQAWKEFETWFDKVHQGFFDRLIAQYPNLTPTELKICSLLRLNMSTKDIALLTNRSIGTVDNMRSSIRRKLQLDAEANLTCFLLNL